MVSISRAWYNGLYTMASKPIKSFELHYTMIQFLIIMDIAAGFPGSLPGLRTEIFPLKRDEIFLIDIFLQIMACKLTNLKNQ